MSTAGRLLGIFCLLIATAGCASTKPAKKPRATPSAAPATQAAPSANSPDLSAYRLGIGDRVRIDVFGEADLSLDAYVDGTGQISYPLLGTIPALKLTASDLESDLTRRLSAGYLIDPQVRVTVVQYRPFYAIGQVRKPGPYPYVIGLTVEKALAIAGGLTNLASTRQMFLLREDSTPAKRIKVGLDSLVLPGDTLLVEEGLF